MHIQKTTKNLRCLALPLMMCVAMASLLLASCTKSVRPTQILVQDSIRHYYPLVQGMDLTLLWRVANVGSTPLVITDIQPSCGCIIEDAGQEKVIAPGKQELLKFTFRSDKNSGFIRHTVRLFGNMEPNGMACLTFDLNVVEPANGTSDYEEQHRERVNNGTAEAKPTDISEELAKRDYWINKKEYKGHYNEAFWKKAMMLRNGMK